MNCCWMDWNVTVNVDLKLNENYFSFSFKAFMLPSFQGVDQDLCSSIFTSALALGSLEALGTGGQNGLTGNLRAVLQLFLLPFSSPDENWKPWLLRRWQPRKRLNLLLVLMFSWESFEISMLPQHFLSWWTGFSRSTASHQQIFNQLCIGTVLCEDLKKAFLIQWFRFLPEELTSILDEGYCTDLIKSF